MGISEREHHIKVLEKLLKETNGKIELYSENKNIDLTKEKEIVETLGYAISSLKTDLKYDLVYEREGSTTKNNLGVDCISKQAVLNNLLERLKDYKTKKPYITHISIDDLISALQMAKEQQGDNV